MQRTSKRKLLSAYLLVLAGIGCAVLLGIGVTTAGSETKSISYGTTQTMLSAKPEAGGIRLRAGSAELMLDAAVLRQWAGYLRPVQFFLPAPLADMIWFAQETAGFVRTLEENIS